MEFVQLTTLSLCQNQFQLVKTAYYIYEIRGGGAWNLYS